MWTGLSRTRRSEGRTRLVPHTNLIHVFRHAEYVRTTSLLSFGAESAKPFFPGAERRLHDEAVGALPRPKMTPAFAWLVGERPTFELEVLEVVDRELTLLMANAMLVPQEVTVAINGNILGVIELPVANHQVKTTFDVPATMQRRGVNEVQLVAAGTEMRKLIDEQVALPLSAIMNRVEFVAAGQEVSKERLVRPGVQALAEGEGSVVVMPAGTALRAGLRLPDVEPVVLDLDVTQADVPFELSMRASMQPRHVLIDSAATPGTHRVDLSRWAGETVLLEFWAKGTLDEAQNARGAVQIDRGVLLVHEDDLDVLEPEPLAAPRGAVSPNGESASFGDDRPSFLVVVLDSLARNRTSAYGADLPTTPMLEGLVQRGWTATDVRAPASYTLASVATLLTGQEPLSHGVSVLPSDQATLALAGHSPKLAELFAEGGWRTAGWVANTNASSRHGYDTGFEVWEDLHDNPEIADNHVVDGKHIPPRLGTFLSTLGADESFFAYAHVFEPHAPYNAPPDLFAEFVDPYRGPVTGTRSWINTWKGEDTPIDAAGWRHLEQRYAARVAYADRILGQLIAEVERAGRAENTVIVVVSDHGEALGEHQSIEHGDLVYDEQIVVPLVFVVPGWDAGRIDGPATLSDVAPTLLGLAGIAPHAAMDGVDLLANVPAPDRPRLSRSYAALPVIALTRGRYKLIYDTATRRRQLFDIVNDPGELRDISATRQAEVQTMFREMVREFVDADDEASERATSPETLKQLRELGYIAGEGEGSATEAARSALRARLRRY